MRFAIALRTVGARFRPTGAERAVVVASSAVVVVVATPVVVVVVVETRVHGGAFARDDVDVNSRRSCTSR